MTNFWTKLNKPIIAVAPMDGVTDYAYRHICKQNGADVLYTEFVSVDGIYHALDKMKPQMAFDDDQRPIICQLFGKDPEMFAHGARIASEAGFDGIDINFGCPSKRVVQHGSGVKLMTNLPLVHDIIEATIEGAQDKPVSLKIRSGIKHSTAEEMIDHVKKLPFSAVMIHGRTYEQGFTGELDVYQVKKVKELAGDRIVLVNGGITSPKNAKDILEKTGVDGVGIGRGVFGKPWLLQQIKDYLATGKYTEPGWDEIKKIMLEHAEYIFKQKGNHGLLEIRKHLSWYIRRFPNAGKYRADLVRVESVEDVKEILAKIDA